jgi:hypothetical protein
MSPIGLLKGSDYTTLAELAKRARPQRKQLADRKLL